MKLTALDLKVLHRQSNIPKYKGIFYQAESGKWRFNIVHKGRSYTGNWFKTQQLARLGMAKKYNSLRMA